MKKATQDKIGNFLFWACLVVAFLDVQGMFLAARLKADGAVFAFAFGAIWFTISALIHYLRLPVKK